jgi:mRNA interferase HigB
MRIVTERKLKEFWQKNKSSEKALRDWIRAIHLADWHNFSDVRKTFNHADVYKNCVIFDVGGNKYRVIAKVEYKLHIVFIRFVLTHVEYDEKKWQFDCK